jgi:release factor glutamine methyltransferase
LGTGSGAIAIALAREAGDVSFVATDISKDALRVAKENARSVGVLNKIEFVMGDLFSPFPIKETFDLILSNPPYIHRSEWKGLMREVRDYEPKIALDGGKDGLDFYRKMISQAPSYLKNKGWLVVEVGSGQADRVSEMIKAREGFQKSERVKDLSGIERVVKAQKK